MKKRSVVSVVVGLMTIGLILVGAAELGANPSFTIGSNRYLTVFAYPHDIIEWPDQGVVFYASPQSLPWQGDVDDISNRPSESYTNSYQSVEFATPSDYAGSPSDVHSWMEVSGYAYKTRYVLGGLYTTDYGKFLVELGRTGIDMDLTAEGIGRAYESIGTATDYYMVPFDGQTLAAQQDLDVTVTFARRMFDRPIGLRLRYIRKSSDVPEGYIAFSREGQTVSTPHLTWGWATTGCNHIFGYSHINTDAFFQNSYTVYNGHQLDLQISTERPDGNHKAGLRYRTSTEDGENYDWEYADGSEYVGWYVNDEYWKDRRTVRLIRAYDKVRFWQFDKLDAGVLFFLQHDISATTAINKLTESEPGSREASREWAVEANPWFNYKTEKGYLDFGFLCEIAQINMKNTQTRWNGVSHSDQTDVLWSTTPYSGWSPDWESFSRGREWFFATGIEAYSSIAVYRRMAVLSKLTVLRKYTFVEKEYGQSAIPDGGDSYEFTTTHTRNNFRNETWMTGAIGLSYGFGPMQAFLTMQLPLAYLIEQKTRLKEGSTELFEHTQKRMWQLQEPVTMRLMLVWALGPRPTGHGR